MGLFRLVARVGCWRRRATFVLEEWSPSPRESGDEQNPAYRPSGTFTCRRHCEERNDAAIQKRAGLLPPAFAGVAMTVKERHGQAE